MDGENGGVGGGGGGERGIEVGEEGDYVGLPIATLSPREWLLY